MMKECKECLEDPILKNRYNRIMIEFTTLVEQIMDFIKASSWPPTADNIRKIGQKAEWLSQRAFKYAAELEEKQNDMAS